MVDLEYLTTRQAAGLLGVHESSIKRWCKGGEMAFDTTGGGHRRIAVRDLVEFARSRSLNCSLLAFDHWIEAVWNACQLAINKRDYSRLVDFAYDRIEGSEPALVYRLFDFCVENGITHGELFDRVMAPILYRVGDEWHAGRLDIGEEHRITELLLDVVYRLRHAFFPGASVGTNRVALVGGCEGSKHDMGAQVVRLVLEAHGWRVIYVGANVPAQNYALLQARYNAQLVCISVVPPSAISDSYRLTEVLSRFYDEKKPYRLVFGGDVFSEAMDRVPSHPAFLEVKVYNSILAFESWLNSVDISHFESDSR